MRKLIVLLLCIVLLFSFIGCSDNTQENQLKTPMTDEIEKQFYLEGSEVLLEISEYFNENQYDFKKVNNLKEKYGKYSLNEKQKEFYSSIKLCISDLIVYQDALKNKDYQGMKIGKEAFSYDFENAVNFIRVNNLINND